MLMIVVYICKNIKNIYSRGRYGLNLASGSFIVYFEWIIHLIYLCIFYLEDCIINKRQL